MTPKSFSIILAAAAFLAVTPAFAGNLTFDNGQTEWHSTQCTKPNAPSSVSAAHPETAGDDMNGLVAMHNAYVDAAQNYMNCVQAEADRDQNLASQTIVSGANKAISDMQSDITQASRALRSHDER